MENVIEFLTNEKIATVTFHQKKFVNKIMKLAEKYPDQVQIIAHNKDGTILAHIPVSWIKIYSTPELSQERKEELAKYVKTHLKQYQFKSAKDKGEGPDKEGT